MNMIIAVDFDGTLVEHEFPKIGKPKMKVIKFVKELKDRGCKLILWTCREDIESGNYLSQAVEFCKQYGLYFDAINDNIQPYKNHLFTNCRKVYADLYIDDKNLNSITIE